MMPGLEMLQKPAQLSLQSSCASESHMPMFVFCTVPRLETRKGTTHVQYGRRLRPPSIIARAGVFFPLSFFSLPPASFSSVIIAILRTR